MLYKSELIKSFETIGYSCCIMMSIVIGPKWSFNSCCDYIGLLGTGFMQVLYLGRAPRTKETLTNFLKWRRVTRHSRVFRGLTGSQLTPRVWVVTHPNPMAIYSASTVDNATEFCFLLCQDRSE